MLNKVKYKKTFKDLPIELIMIIYSHCNNESQAILNQICKLNYKYFNPISGLPLKLYSIISQYRITQDETPTFIIDGYLTIKLNERWCDVGNTIKSLKRENRRLNNKIDFLILLLEQKHNIVIPEIDI